MFKNRITFDIINYKDVGSMSLKKLFWTIIIVAIIGAGGILTYSLIKDHYAWKVEIAIEEINVRSKHDLYEAKVGTVYEGEKYNVLEIYLKDKRYVWYKIKYDKGKEGWIASGRNNPYVKEINNPNAKDNYETGESYQLDYKKPVVKFTDNIYSVYDIKSINYDHLTIEEDSEYKIEHKIYYEAESVDTHLPQYWIQYIVTDAAGNVTKKVQQIKFDIEPDPNSVLKFADLER